MTTSDWINLAIAVFAGMSAVIALAYTVVTCRILQNSRATVETMRQQLRALTRPYIQITPVVRIGTQLLTLSIQNTGSSAAFKLRLKLDRDFFAFGEDREGRNLAKYSAFSTTIESFPPKAELLFHLGTGPSLFVDPNKSPMSFGVSATYLFDGTEVTETTVIDLEPFRNSAVPIDAMVEEMEKLRSTIEGLSSSLRDRH